MNKAIELIELIEKSCKKKKKSEELTLDDFSDLLQDYKKKGFDDEEKLKGMLKKAIEIAKEQGKGDDKNTVTGILQSFFKAK